ncbi:TonB-dependent receptor [Alteromonas sp. SM 2104]|nr:TonB-dependent receptor [Alteromonas oceanisediminis]
MSSMVFAHPTLDHVASQAEIESISVKGRQTHLIGEAISTSQGYAGQADIAARPMLRTGDILELVPGMAVTQHSGSGKANQYFLRGFNLDHGTDFATWIDGMPVNLRTHGHGQGYTDLNFIIPETIGSLEYRKGAYYSDVGDFSGSGSAWFNTTSAVSDPTLSLTVGEFGYRRGVITQGAELSDGTLNYALERQTYSGPWTDINEDVDKTNAFVKYSTPLLGGKLSVSVMGYDNQWNSADQIPLRAVQSGLIDEFGSIDTTTGGESSRYSVNTIWRSNDITLGAYWISYDLNLWSNFTYFLENPTAGDQFEQVDDRTTYGGFAEKRMATPLGSIDAITTVGVQLQVDNIDEVGLHATQQRLRRGAIRSDSVMERSAGLYVENQAFWTPSLRTVIGARVDRYDFDVRSLIDTNVNGVDLSANRGEESDSNVSLKASLIYQFSDAVETYASIGQGFHSNDARGTIQQVDPASGDAVQPVDPLVDSLGYEVGVRAELSQHMHLSAALWALDVDSELLFVGDAGNTEASGESERRGIELTAYYAITSQWAVDLEYAYTDAQFSDLPSGENHIPGAIEQVVQAGVNYESDSWFGSVRLRHFGERPLVEDGRETSDRTTLVNAKVGYTFEQVTVSLELLNAFDSQDHDIDYFYESRLPGEAIGVEDQHYHILEPRSLRASVSYRF